MANDAEFYATALADAIEGADTVIDNSGHDWLTVYCETLLPELQEHWDGPPGDFVRAAIAKTVWPGTATAADLFSVYLKIGATSAAAQSVARIEAHADHVARLDDLKALIDTTAPGVGEALEKVEAAAQAQSVIGPTKLCFSGT